MRTSDLEIALMKHFKFQQNYIVPQLTNMNNLTRFETDLLVVTKAGYATGIEIKVSKSDLKNDLKKTHWKNIDIKNYFQGKSGLEYYFEKIKHFYYAVPERLKEEALNQIPEWCGLLVGYEINNSINENHIKIKEERGAGYLSSYKWSDKELFDLLRLGTMRIYNLKKKLAIY